MEFIRSLTAVNRHDVALAGGKAANLGELALARLPVPPGFVLLTSAYTAFVEANALTEAILSLAQQASLQSLEQLEESSCAIRSLFDQSAMPIEIAQAILRAYRDLGGDAVSVRSSATAEDLPAASFAGQQETFLNVRGEEALLEAVKRSWASLWTARALAYRTRQEISSESASLAVIVQQMLPADAAGILFTLNPLTGAQDEIVINASWGLGEALVGGRVNPDTLRVKKATGRIIEMKIGEKAVMTVRKEQGTAEVAVQDERRHQQVLSPEQVTELLRLGCEIEAQFGVPQDIEWAIVGEKLSLLQARPVTAVSSPGGMQADQVPVPPGDDTWDSEGILPPQSFDLWTRTNVGESLPFPITPLTATGFPALFGLDKAPQSDQGLRRFYGRLYLNEGALLHNLEETYGIPPSFIGRIWGSHRQGTAQVTGKWWPWRLLRSLPGLFRQGFSATRPKGPRQTPQEFFAQIDTWVNEFLQKDLSLLDDQALWDEALPIWSERGASVWATNLRISTPAGLMLGALAWIVGWWTKLSKLVPDLVSGLPGMYAAEVGPALWRMAQTLRELDVSHVVLDHRPHEALALLQTLPEATPFNEQLQSFLQRHGHRCPNEVEFLNPRWKEAPEQVIELVANYLQAGEIINTNEVEERQRQRRAEAVTQIETKLDPLRRAIFRAVLKKAQQAIPIRDNSRYFVTKFVFPLRKLYAQLGQRWAERGWLRFPDDIFFLTVAEIGAIIKAGTPSGVSQDLYTLTANRRLAYEYWFTIVPPDVIGPDEKPVREEEENVQVLEGIAASGGQVRGIARIVLDPHEAATLRTGEILVTQATDPGWTPVFPLLSGLVLEIGGQISHGAIVAREYGLPAVVNVRGATRFIRDGQTIIVDGTNGKVLLKEEALASPLLV